MKVEAKKSACSMAVGTRLGTVIRFATVSVGGRKNRPFNFCLDLLTKYPDRARWEQIRQNVQASVKVRLHSPLQLAHVVQRRRTSWPPPIELGPDGSDGASLVEATTPYATRPPPDRQSIAT